MKNAFDSVEELRRHGLAGNSVPSTTEQVLSTLTKPQVDFLVKAQQQIAARQGAPAVGSDGSENLALAVTQAMGWDRPSATAVDAEVEGMEEGNCLCACTGGGGGGGA
jgi:hypothetical protein